MNMKVKKERTLILPLESVLYLSEECRHQRIGDHLSDKAKEMIKKNFLKHKDNYLVYDGSFGGAIGDPKNSYEEGRWTSWKIEDMKRMLDKQGLPYKDGEEIETIGIGI